MPGRANQLFDPKSRAISLYKSGSTKQAYKILKQYVSKTPNDIEALGLIAEMYIHKRNFTKAEKHLSAVLQAIEKQPGSAKAKFAHLQNLIGVLLVARQHEKAASACDRFLTTWPAGTTPSAQERECLLALAKYCLKFGRYKKGAEFWESCRAFFDDSNASALEIDGRFALARGGLIGSAEAVQALGRAKRLDPTSFSIACAYAAAVCLYKPQRSRRALRDAFSLAPVVSCSRLATQGKHVLLLNIPPSRISIKSLTESDIHFTDNYPGQFFRLRQKNYLISSVFPEYAETFQLRELQEFHLIINNMATPEAVSSDLEARANALTSEFNVPLINPVDQMAEMHRSSLNKMFAGVDGVRTPKTVLVQREGRNWKDVARAVEEEFDYPIILRTPTAHQSSSSQFKKELKKISVKLVANRSELIELSEAKNWTSFYAIEYLDLKKPSNVFRKIRAVMIGNELVIHSLVYWNEWLVGGWRIGDRAAQFYRENPNLWKEGVNAVLEPEKHLGETTMNTLKKLRERVPLDFFGVDFDIGDSGELAIFEVSASMIFLPAGAPPPGFELPREPSNRINAAFERLIEEKIASASNPRNRLH